MNVTNKNFQPTEIISHKHNNWIVPFGLSLYSVLITIDIYLIIALINYGIRTGKWFRQTQKQIFEVLNTGSIYSSLVICAVLALIYHVLVVVYSTVGYNENESMICEVINDVRRGVYVLILSGVSMFLWLRQRVFYTTYLPNAMFGKAVKCFSFMIIFLVLTGLIIASTLTHIPRNHTSSPNGCVYVSDGNSFSIGIFIGMASVALSQISLLYLFLNALLKTKRSDLCGNYRGFPFCCQNIELENAQTSKKINKTTEIVQIIIKKTFIFAVLSLICDFVTLSLALVLSKENQREDVTTIIGSIDISANVMFLILSFISWKEMITSPFKSFSTPVENSVTCSETFEITSG